MTINSIASVSKTSFLLQTTENPGNRLCTNFAHVYIFMINSVQRCRTNSKLYAYCVYRQYLHPENRKFSQPALTFYRPPLPCLLPTSVVLSHALSTVLEHLVPVEVKCQDHKIYSISSLEHLYVSVSFLTSLLENCIAQLALELFSYPDCILQTCHL